MQNDNKKIKLEEDQESSPLLSLLKSNKTFKSNHLQVPKNIVLTQQQLLAARKLISNIGSSSVNTYLTMKPVLVPASQGMNETKNYSNIPDQAELSPTYPKIINPVSIKAERTDFDTLMAPPNNSLMDSDVLTTFSKVDTNITKPTFTANSNASRNLNEINRTQSEKELMALVDGDNVSADGKSIDLKLHKILIITSFNFSVLWHSTRKCAKSLPQIHSLTLLLLHVFVEVFYRNHLDALRKLLRTKTR